MGPTRSFDNVYNSFLIPIYLNMFIIVGHSVYKVIFTFMA